MERAILHINIPSFYCSVAGIGTPSLAGYPVVVATAGRQRRVVLDASAQARQAGIRKGMYVDEAIRGCPDLTVLDPLPGAYATVSGALMREAARFSPFVEPAGPGHIFVDLSGTGRLFGAPIDAAEKVRKAMISGSGLDCCAGLASNKLVSKVATRVAAAALCAVMTGCEPCFIAPLPLAYLPGMERDMVRRLYQFNLRTAAQVLAIPVRHLSRALGSAAAGVYAICGGIDTTPVRRADTPAPVFMEEVKLKEQTNDHACILKALFTVTGRLGAALRRAGLGATAINVAVLFTDGTGASRSCRVRAPVQGDISLFEHAASLLVRILSRRIRVSGITMRLSELAYPYGQMDLFAAARHEEQLMTALDRIRAKFGAAAIDFWGTPELKKIMNYEL